MGVIDFLFRRTAGRMLVKAAGLPVVPSYVRQSILEPTFHRLIRDGYQKNAVVFACVSALTMAFFEPPLQVYADERDDAPVIPNHRLRTLLTKPNALMGEAELLAITMTYMAIGGNAYWHKVRNRRGDVIEVWPYHAGHFRAVPGGDSWISGYEFNPGDGSQTPIDLADVVHFKWPLIDPTQPWQAQPPLQAAAMEVDTDAEASTYLYSLLKNDAIPRTVIKQPPGLILDDDVIRRIKDQWRERYSGARRGDVAVLESGAEVERIGLDLEQLAFEALHRLPETRIAAAFRVPAIVAGLSAGLERSTYANYGQARTAFTRDTLVPLWRIVASEVAADLLPELRAPQGDVRFDTTRVSSLKEDQDKKWGRITGAYRDNLLTQNEARAALGYPPRPDGDRTTRDPVEVTA